MSIEYLQNVNGRYDDFIFHQYTGDVLVIDVDHIDFLHNPKDLGDIIDKIDARLYGFFQNSK